jgi:cytochrome oxidase Cu insertion factor (SCO1/SenC/PrrC family)
MSVSESAARARGRRNFLILAALFLVPVIASFALYFGGIWKPSASSAKGELIQPPRTLDYAGVRAIDGTNFDLKTLEGRWSLLYIGHDCDEIARTALTYARQSRLALGKDMGRVQRVFIRAGSCNGLIGEGCCPDDYLEKEHAGLIRLEATAPEFTRMLQQFPGDVRHSVYIVDPHHNLMMRHDASVVVNKALLTDLKKLLKLSQIG